MSTVVIAENETATRKLLAKLLTDEDFKVTSVGAAGEVFESVMSVKPDVMLLDASMPKLNARDLIKKLRERGEDVPVIMIGGKNTAAPRLLEPHIMGWIARPVVAKDLLMKVQRTLVRFQTSRGAQTSRVLEVPLSELHDPESGRINAKKVAEFLGVDLTEISAALETNYQTVYKTPDAPGLQERLRPIKRSIELISRATRSPSDARAWLNNPHPDLGGRTPLEVILSGRASALVTVLANALSGIPS